MSRARSWAVPRHRRLLVAGVAIAVLSVAGIAAAALTPVLVRDHPLLLIVLEARNRYLLLVAGRVDLWPFLVVGVLRRFASDPFYYLLGRWYGDRALAWLAERTPGGEEAVARGRSAFDRVADLLVFAFPGALVCVLAGADRMSLRRFVTLNLVGSVVTVGALWWVADRAAWLIGPIVTFNDANAGWLTGVVAVLVLGWLALGWRRGEGPTAAWRDLLGLEEPEDDGTGGDDDPGRPSEPGRPPGPGPGDGGDPDDDQAEGVRSDGAG